MYFLSKTLVNHIILSTVFLLNFSQKANCTQGKCVITKGMTEATGGCAGCDSSLKKLEDLVKIMEFENCPCRDKNGKATGKGSFLIPGVTIRPTVPLGSTVTEDCDKLYRDGVVDNGVYIVPLGGVETQVYCEFSNDGYNWLVILRRMNGVVDFYKPWESYKHGFGDKGKEFFIGLQKLNALTVSNDYLLRVELEDWKGKTAYAEYRVFKVGDESTKYKLTVDGYSGNAQDSLSYQNNYPFTTKDRDNDDVPYNCAVKHHGGWWYNACHDSNLTGRYLKGGQISDGGINWWYWKKSYYSVKKAVMKLRKK